MKKRILSIMAVAALALNMTACGANTTDDTGAEVSATATHKQTIAETQTEPETKIETEIEEKPESTSAQTEKVSEVSESSDSSDLFGYYEQLDTEYAKQKFVCSTLSNGYIFVKTLDNIYFSKGGNQLGKWYSYDMNTKELNDFLDLYHVYDDKIEYYGFYDGFFYFLVNNTLQKYNQDGELVNQFNSESCGKETAIRYGGVSVIKNSNENPVLDNIAFYVAVNDENMLISSDFEVLADDIKLWLEEPGEHGTVNKVNPDFIFTSNGELYAYYQNNSPFFCKIYKYNKETNSLVYTENLLERVGEYKVSDLAIHTGDTNDYIRFSGKYCLVPGRNSTHNLTNMETGEKIASISGDYGRNFAQTYFGEGCNIMLNNNKWLKVRIPDNGEKREKIEHYGKETTDASKIVQLDNTYYLVVDSYGIFLRTYEHGEEEEEVILRN